MKELSQYLKATNSLLILLFGLLILPFNKVVFVDYPEYFTGKFNFFQTQTIYLPALAILLGCIVFISLSKNKVEVKNLNLAEILLSVFLLYAFLRTGQVIFLISAVLLITLSNLSRKQSKLIIYSLIITAFFQVVLSVIQLLIQTDIGLKIVGEPEINENIKGIAKIRTEYGVLLRPYGTFPHPNVLGGFLGLVLLISTKVKHKYILILGILNSLSISANLSALVSNIFNKRNLVLTLILFVTLSSTVAIRFLDNNRDSINERIKQTEQIVTYKLNIKTFIFGSTQNVETNIKQKPWEYTPKHNTYLQTFQVFGLLGLLLLIFSIVSLSKINIALTTFIAVILLFDHYWITTPQGTLMLTLAFGLSKHLQNENT